MVNGSLEQWAWLLLVLFGPADQHSSRNSPLKHFVDFKNALSTLKNAFAQHPQFIRPHTRIGGIKSDEI